MTTTMMMLMTMAILIKHNHNHNGLFSVISEVITFNDQIRIDQFAHRGQKRWLIYTSNFIKIIKSELIKYNLVLVSFERVERVDGEHPMISFFISFLSRNIRYSVAKLIIYFSGTKQIGSWMISDLFLDISSRVRSLH